MKRSESLVRTATWLKPFVSIASLCRTRAEWEALAPMREDGTHERRRTRIRTVTRALRCRAGGGRRRDAGRGAAPAVLAPGRTLDGGDRPAARRAPAG